MKAPSDVVIDAETGACSPRVWETCFLLAMRAARAPTLTLDEFQDELTRAELAGEISEFYALGVQAIFSLAYSSGFAPDYLGMAEFVIRNDSERAVMGQWRALQQLVEADDGDQLAEGAAGFGAARLVQSALRLHDKELTELCQTLMKALRQVSRAH